MDAVIELREVSLVRDSTTILDSVSLVVPKGSCVVVMGYSGSGHTALLKTAAGLVPADRGKVYFEGRDMDRMSEAELFRFRGRCGFVFQDAALWANMSVYQNVALPLQFHRRGIGRDEIDARIRELLREFDFRDNPELRPARLSAGERKQVSFIRAMILDPEVLFLDDPTSSIDNVLADRILSIMAGGKRRGRTLVIATHSAAFTTRLADYLVVLREGRVVEQGPIGEVLRSSDPYVAAVLSENLSQAAAYDGDILDLLEDGGFPGED